MTHLFHPEADAEFYEAVAYYGNLSPSLAMRFDEEVRAGIRRIVQSPKRFAFLDGDVRRCPTRLFPFRILYTIESDYILIVAVAHNKREPRYWKRRLRQRS